MVKKEKEVGNTVSTGLPQWSSDKESACNTGETNRHRSDPPVWKISWRRAWQPTPVFLPGESHGQRSLVGCIPRGQKELDMTEATEHAHTCLFPWQYLIMLSLKNYLSTEMINFIFEKYELYWDTLVGV